MFTAWTRSQASTDDLLREAILLFGGWWVLSANRWFKGPVRMGTEEELEQMEAQLEASTRIRPEPAA